MVKSHPRSASEFRLRLPMLCFHESRSEAHAGSGDSLSGKTFPRRLRRILVAEDNPVNRKVAVRMLEKLGCLVDVASNGKVAVEMTACFPYETIFMDCGMPVMDGYTATEEIRLHQNMDSRVPIVAVTAHAVGNARDECLAAGMDDYLAKPIKSGDLERALAKWCP
jgi:two-component system, sensor histidine kinase and response regulator